MTDVNLPQGWLEVTLADIADWGSGGTPSRKMSHYFCGQIPWIKTGELGNKFIRSSEEHITEDAILSSSAKIFPRGSVGIAMYGATIGKTSIFGIDASTNQACAVAIPSQAVNNEFLYYFLLSEKNGFIKAGTGGAQPNISQGVIKSWPIKLPPLAEQQRIVAKIEELFSELDKGVENLRTAQQQLKVYRQALLKHAFEGKLTADWRAQRMDAAQGSASVAGGQEPGATQLESADALLARIQQEREAHYQQQLQEWESNGKAGRKPKAPKALPPLTGEALAELPEGWGWFHLAQLLSEDLCNGKSVKDRNNGFPVLRLNALGNGRIDLSVTKQGDWSEEEARPYFVNENDFLVSRGNGSKHLVGRGGFARYNTTTSEHVAFPDTMIRVRICQENIDSLYFGYCWDSFLVRRQIEKSARTTAGSYKIYQGLMERFVIPAPCIEEQKIISTVLSEKLSLIDQLEQTIAHSLQQAEALRQSILKKAFSGQLVPQDPNDEPASVLLERLYAERAAQPKVRGRKAKVSA